MAVASFPGERRQAGKGGLLFEPTGRAWEHWHTGIHREGIFYPCSLVAEGRKPCRAALPVSVRHMHTSLLSCLHSDHEFWRPPPSIKAKLKSQWCRLSLLTPYKSFSYSSSCSISADAEPFIKKYLLFRILHMLVLPWGLSIRGSNKVRCNL